MIALTLAASGISALLVMLVLTVTLMKFLRRLLNRWRGGRAAAAAGG
jgi:hypothetical protein